jgi:cysteine desulfurase
MPPPVLSVPTGPDMDNLIYLDHNATTPTSPEVLELMLPWFRERPGNPSSTHQAGREAAAAVEQARQRVAEAVGAVPGEIVFTAGATEANNLVLRGVEGRVVVAATEHKAVLETARDLGEGCFTVVPVWSDGRIDLEAIREAAQGASLISIMLGNNETGVIQDVEAVVDLAARLGCRVHTDATQALGKIPVDLRSLGVDFASFSAHKIYGPKGVGALFMRKGSRLHPLITGGGHERGIRSGTLNVPGIVGFGAAAMFLPGPADARETRRLTGELLGKLRSSCAEVDLFSDHEAGLPNTLCVRLCGADGEAVMAHAPRVAMSVGAACTSSIPEPSHVLLAMGVQPEAAYETVRLSLGKDTTVHDVDVAVEQIASAVERVRSMTGYYAKTMSLGGPA